MTVSKLRGYRDYQLTNTKWLQQVPSCWQFIEGKRIFSNRRELSRKDDDQLAASQSFGVVPQSLMMEANESKVMLALNGTSTFRHVEVDDFVISLRSFEGGIEHSQYRGCVSPAYTVLAAQKPIVPKYFRYLLKSEPFVAALQSTTDSLRDGKAISYSQFGWLKLPLPALNEQKQIAEFLEYETAKIDALIDKQQQLIVLLGEKRQAIINHAVTKGLKHGAPMNYSGVKSLGEVPGHWKVCRLKHTITFLTSGPRGWSDQVADQGNSVFLQSGDLDDELGLRLDTAKRITRQLTQRECEPSCEWATSCVV